MMVLGVVGNVFTNLKMDTGQRVIDEYEDHENPEKPVLGDMMPKKGFWEIGVFYNGELCYDSPITDDVLRHQSDPDVDNVLGKISRL